MVNVGQMVAGLSLDHRKFTLGLKSVERQTLAFNKGLASTRKRLVGLGKGFSFLRGPMMRMVTLLGAGGLAYAVQSFARTSIVSFAKFETALVDMGKVTAQSSEDIVRQLNKIPPILGSMTELMRGYYQVISAGVTQPLKATELLTTASKLSNAAHIQQTEAIKALTKMLVGFQGELKDATDASDLLFMMEKQGQTTVQELVPVIGGLASMTKMAGARAEEMAAALATLTLTAGTTAEAATRYQGVIVGLLKPQESLKKVLKELDYASASLMIRELGLVGTLEKVRAKAEDLGFNLTQVLGRKEAMLGATDLLANASAAYNERLEAMYQRAGKTDKAFGEWLTTLDAIWKAFKNVLSNTFVAIGQKLEKTIKRIVKQATAWLDANKEMIAQKVGDYFEAIGKAVVFVYDSIGLLIFATKAFIAYQLGAILSGIAAMAINAGGAIALLNRQLVALGILAKSLSTATKGGLIGLALFGLYETLDWAFKKFDSVKIAMFTLVAVFRKGWESIKLTAKLVWLGIKYIFTRTIDDLKEAWAGFLDWIVDKTPDFAKKILQTMGIDLPERLVTEYGKAGDKIVKEIEETLNESAAAMVRIDKEAVDAIVAINAKAVELIGKTRKEAIELPPPPAPKEEPVATAIGQKLEITLFEQVQSWVNAVKSSGKVWEEGINKTGQKFYKQVSVTADSTTGALKNVFGDMIGGMLGAALAWGELALQVINIVQSIVELPIKILDALTHLFDFIGNLPSLLAQSLINLMKSVGEMIKNFIVGIWRDLIPAIIELPFILIMGIVEAIPIIVEAIIEMIPKIVIKLITRLLVAIPRLIAAILNLVPTIIMAVIEGIPLIIQEIIAALPAIAKAFVDALLSMLTFGLVGGGGGGIFDIFHEGGVVKKAHRGLKIPSLGREEVPVIARAGERILSREEYAGVGGEKGLADAAGGQVTIQFNAEVLTAKSSAEFISEVIEELKQRRLGRQYKVVELATMGISL